MPVQFPNGIGVTRDVSASGVFFEMTLSFSPGGGHQVFSAPGAHGSGGSDAPPLPEEDRARGAPSLTRFLTDRCILGFRSSLERLLLQPVKRRDLSNSTLNLNWLSREWWLPAGSATPCWFGHPPSIGFVSPGPAIEPIPSSLRCTNGHLLSTATLLGIIFSGKRP